MIGVKDFFTLLKESFTEWREDDASRLAAALAYYTIFSLAPLLIVVIAVAGFFFGEAAVQGEIVGQIEGLVGQEGAQLIEGMVARAGRGGADIIATIVGLATLLLGSTRVFSQLQDALNTVWEVEPDPDRPLLSTVKDRLLSFSMVLGIGFLLLVSLVISAVLSALDQYLTNLLPGGGLILQVLNFVISFGVITLLFAMIYKALPDVEIDWDDVWVGGAITALLFVIGKFLVGIYLGRSGVASTYGAAGSLVIVLLWIYYSAQILLFGAEFTEVYARRYGTRIVPEEGAVPIGERARAQQGAYPEAAAGDPVRTTGDQTPVQRSSVQVSDEVSTPAAIGFFGLLAISSFVLGLFRGNR